MLTLCMLGNFSCFCCRLLNFFKNNILNNSFRNTVRVSNGLDPDQDRHFVRSDLGPNCLQRLSAEDMVLLWSADFFKINFFSKILP